MEADLRIIIKGYHRKKNLKVLLSRPPFPSRQFLVRMNPDRLGWQVGGQPLSLTRLVTALRKSPVRAGRGSDG